MTRRAPERLFETADVPARTTVEAHACNAENQLAAALSLIATLHEPGQRERYRRLLGDAIDHAGRALAEAQPATAEERGARSTLARAHAARAEDALHGAGQLSLSAQRSPTREACDDGWRRVETIVAGAETSAAAAAKNALELEVLAPHSRLARAACTAARRAKAAAAAARQIVEQRNHAYTFHTDSGFSFGEGWYLAAAALLSGVAIQIEPGHAAAQAEKFLHDAGLSRQCQAYRSRPRAMKHTTALIAQAFRADPASAQERLRTAFLGAAPIPEAVREWVDSRLPPPYAGRSCKKVLMWIRDGVHHQRRNTNHAELLELTARVQQAGFLPVLTGDALPGGELPGRALDMILFWKDAVFRGIDMRRAQLQFFEHLKTAHGLVGQLGVTTAGMDGPALMGLPTLYLTDAPNVRMGQWVGAVPGYQELVRERGYLEQVDRVLSDWARGGG